MASIRSSLHSRRRNSARLALYSSLGLIGGLLVAILAWMRPSLEFGMQTGWQRVDWESNPDVRLLQQYVRINTAVPPDGDPKAGAQWLAAQLLSMGLLPVVESVGEEANVWAILEGQEREAVVLHSHLDVDPTGSGKGWTHPPFSGVIDGPWIHGRGTFDMKSVTVAQLGALRRLVESGQRPRKSVIFLATTGEEVGSDLGTKWILRHHPELVDRFGVVLTEGGAVEGRSLDDFKFWGTEVVQKRLLDVTLCGSEEALEGIVTEMKRTGAWGGEPRLVPEVERFLQPYAASRDSVELQEQLDDPAALLADRAAYSTLPRYLKAYFRNELIPVGVYDVPGGQELHLRLVILPGQDPRRALDELLPPWRRVGLQVEIYDEGGATGGSSPEHWGFRGIDRVLRRERPDVPHAPMVLPLTVTDARFFRGAGIPTYGFSPFAVLTPQVVQLRKRSTINERMLLPGFVEGVDLYSEVLLELAGVADAADPTR